MQEYHILYQRNLDTPRQDTSEECYIKMFGLSKTQRTFIPTTQYAEKEFQEVIHFSMLGLII